MASECTWHIISKHRYITTRQRYRTLTLRGGHSEVNAQVNSSRLRSVRRASVSNGRRIEALAASALMAQSAPAAAPTPVAPGPSSMATDAAPNDRALRARIESKLRLSMESFDIPLSPSLPSSRGEDADVSRTDPMLGVEATPPVAQGAAVFFTEQDFSRMSQQSELFRQRWSEHQTHLHSIFVHTLQEREQREQREKAKAAAYASPTLSRTVTFTTPETAPSTSASPHSQPAPSALARSPSGTASSLSLSFAPTAAAASPPAAAALPRSDMEMAAAAAGVAVSRPSRLSSLSAEEHSVFLQYQIQARVPHRI